MKSKQNTFKAVDIVTLLYLLITGILIMFYFHKIIQPFSLLVFRIVFASFIFLLLQYHNKYPEIKPLKWLRDFYPLLFLAILYTETDTINNLFFSNNLDPFFVNIEESIFKCQPSILFQKSLPYNWFDELMHFSYFSYYLLIIVFIFWVYFKDQSNFNYTFFLILCSFYLYYLVFIIIPVAGPQYYFGGSIEQGANNGIFSFLMRIIHIIGERPTAAFPSSHVGITCLLLYLTFKYAKPLFIWYCLIFIFLASSTIYIRAHYVIDILAGVASSFILFYINKVLYTGFNKGLTSK